MFRSVPLVLVNIQAAEESISQVTAILTRLRIMHLINLVQTPLGKLGYMGELERGLLERYQKAGEEVDRWAAALDILPQVVDIPPDLDPAKDIFALEEKEEEIRGQADALISRYQEVTQELATWRQYQKNLDYLGPVGLDPGGLADLKFAYLAPGWVPTENLPRLEQALEHLHHALIPVTQVENRTLIVLAGLASERDTLEGALKGAFFEHLELPPGAGGAIDDLPGQVAGRIKALETARGELEARRTGLRDRLGPDLVRLRNRIDLIRTLLRARVLFGKVDHSYLISGWIPAHLVKELKAALAQELGDKVEVEVLSPEAMPGAREGILKIPILFNNPYLLRPFERLTRAYGTPSYREVEPTAFLAVSFLLMFGLMFGDVGQGAVLFGLGYLIFRRFFRYTDYGVILMECGVASMIFGVLYGSVFGVENLLPPLWFAPMKNIGYFFKVALTLGLVSISLGLILGLVNAIRLGQRRFPAAGLLAALIYWMLAGLGIRYLLTGAWQWDWWMTVAAGAATLGLGAVFIFLRRRRGPEGPEPAGGGRGLAILEGAIEVVDSTVRYVANTISYIRIAAFALTHAGLFLAVFSLAETLGRMGGGGLAYWLTVALGNVFIIVLEGLVVSIQIVRLEYYEFLSKFFHGGGEPFRPLERGSS